VVAETEKIKAQKPRWSPPKRSIEISSLLIGNNKSQFERRLLNGSKEALIE